ncbi:MAG: polysulfide reductase NrfD [Desulfobacterota bacterium]|nr:polysulfide reductase NrfD [Thermodesulfobacteriota bacterium]MDW8001271.1 NrfD/PsrC family molybdoenzyme membrane anchor subunit [Deltaproteobacteria bacterium]
MRKEFESITIARNGLTLALSKLVLLTFYFIGFLVLLIKELKPKGKVLTAFNVITLPIILLGTYLIITHMFYGLSHGSNVSQDFPWGIFIGFNVMVGVPFAGGAYVLAFVVYILNAEKYHPILRATILNGFLAYVFYASAIFLDLGRKWNILNPIIGNEFGVNSVLFLVAWHFLLYMIAQFIEFSPAIAEWLELKRLRKILSSMTLGACVFGIALSTLHQSGLGALFMMAKNKLHPLWYTEFIPVLFFVSSIFAGLSCVIVEGTISKKVFRHRMSEEYLKNYDDIVIGLARGCAITLFVYFFLKVLIFIHGKSWVYISSPMGIWYLVEVLGFVLIPCLMFYYGQRDRRINLIRVAALVTMLGVIINRINYSMIAYKWYLPLSEKYIPTWQEIVITLTIVFTQLWIFRWVVNRMPVYGEVPEWAKEKELEEEEYQAELGFTMANGGQRYRDY